MLFKGENIGKLLLEVAREECAPGPLRRPGRPAYWQGAGVRRKMHGVPRQSVRPRSTTHGNTMNTKSFAWPIRVMAADAGCRGHPGVRCATPRRRRPHRRRSSRRRHRPRCPHRPPGARTLAGTGQGPGAAAGARCRRATAERRRGHGARHAGQGNRARSDQRPRAEAAGPDQGGCAEGIGTGVLPLHGAARRFAVQARAAVHGRSLPLLHPRQVQRHGEPEQARRRTGDQDPGTRSRPRRLPRPRPPRRRRTDAPRRRNRRPSRARRRRTAAEGQGAGDERQSRRRLRGL